MVYTESFVFSGSGKIMVCQSLMEELLAFKTVYMNAVLNGNDLVICFPNKIFFVSILININNYFAIWKWYSCECFSPSVLVLVPNSSINWAEPDLSHDQ